MHVNMLTNLDDSTRTRLVDAFTAALAAHSSLAGVRFDAPYAVVTAMRRRS